MILAIEKMLKTSLQSAIEKVHSATEAKYKTVNFINEHTRVMKRTIDEGEVCYGFIYRFYTFVENSILMITVHFRREIGRK